MPLLHVHILELMYKRRLCTLVVWKPCVPIHHCTGSCSTMDPLHQGLRQIANATDFTLALSSSQCLNNGKRKAFTESWRILLVSRCSELSGGIAPYCDVLGLGGIEIRMLIQVLAKVRHMIMQKASRLDHRGSPLILVDVCQLRIRVAEENLDDRTGPYARALGICRFGRVF